ncbi:MAG: DNA polymerase III subunit gamma/tau [Alphaproteobacteria bacterium]|nr:DNA polymerase III subunit gamma/tau [Alphaproteobacteria bacterium]
MTEENNNEKQYKVLAIKYRPQNFDDLIGQEALVRTLKNEIESDRIHHSFMLTGIRGIGKTTSARIIAKALNCIGPDGKGRETPNPCGVCEHCKAISQDRHMDVIEMDAASRTGVDDVRELIDSVKYAPVSARYKVYIIDEVHMLSKNAFNALLKTLEEPPAHIKFIFATTEIRKVPVTVLSRCQRFDLSRVSISDLNALYKKIAGLENAEFEDEAISLISKGADGSVRDGLSLLDQAISLSSGKITADQIHNMLGFSDFSRIIDLYDYTMKGKSIEALSLLEDLYNKGVAPNIILQDLIEFNHFISKLKTSTDILNNSIFSEDEKQKGLELSKSISMNTLMRTWQILLKGVEELNYSPNQNYSMDMLIIKLLYMNDMPSPTDIMKSVEGLKKKPNLIPEPVSKSNSIDTKIEVIPSKVEDSKPNPQSFLEVIELFKASKELIITGQLQSSAHLVSFEVGRIKINLSHNLDSEFTRKVSNKLSAITGRDWIVEISDEKGEDSIFEQQKKAYEKEKIEVKQDDNISEILKFFPDAEIKKIRTMN